MLLSDLYLQKPAHAQIYDPNSACTDSRFSIKVCAKFKFKHLAQPIRRWNNRPLLFISLSHSDNQSESATKFYNSFKADVEGNMLTLT